MWGDMTVNVNFEVKACDLKGGGEMRFVGIEMEEDRSHHSES